MNRSVPIRRCGALAALAAVVVVLAACGASEPRPAMEVAGIGYAETELGVDRKSVV